MFPYKMITTYNLKNCFYYKSLITKCWNLCFHRVVWLITHASLEGALAPHSQHNVFGIYYPYIAILIFFRVVRLIISGTICNFSLTHARCYFLCFFFLFGLSWRILLMWNCSYNYKHNKPDLLVLIITVTPKYIIIIHNHEIHLSVWGLTFKRDLKHKTKSDLV